MSGPCQNEINFSSLREMQKTYYEHTQAYPGYYPNTNGYSYDSHHYSPSPGGDGYRSSCLLQGGPVQQTGAQNAYTDTYSYNSSCMQTVNAPYNQVNPPGPGIPPATSPGLKPQVQGPQAQGPEIYPWMRECRQNSKQRQQQLSQQLSGKKRSSFEKCPASG